MAWEWSHSVEAYEAVRLNIGDLPRGRLMLILAEWKANVGDCSDSFDEEIYCSAMQDLERSFLLNRFFAEEIYDLAQDQATCTNGGYEAWICPFGCHTVPFDRDSEVDR